MIETQSAGGVVLDKDGNVLVISQQGKSWSLPKGHIENGEDAMTAARREIREESGIASLDYIRELGTYQRYKIGQDGKEDDAELKTIRMFLFKTGAEDIKPVDPENPEGRWVAKNEVADLLTHPKDKEFFLSIKDAI